MPFGRLIKPPEIARTIVHLATAESGMMTGAVVEWDQTVLGAGDSVFPGPELGAEPLESVSEPVPGAVAPSDLRDVGGVGS